MFWMDGWCVRRHAAVWAGGSVLQHPHPGLWGSCPGTPRACPGTVLQSLFVNICKYFFWTYEVESKAHITRIPFFNSFNGANGFPIVISVWLVLGPSVKWVLLFVILGFFSKVVIADLRGGNDGAGNFLFYIYISPSLKYINDFFCDSSLDSLAPRTSHVAVPNRGLPLIFVKGTAVTSTIAMSGCDGGR